MSEGGACLAENGGAWKGIWLGWNGVSLTLCGCWGLMELRVGLLTSSQRLLAADLAPYFKQCSGDFWPLALGLLERQKVAWDAEAVAALSLSSVCGHLQIGASHPLSILTACRQSGGNLVLTGFLARKTRPTAAPVLTLPLTHGCRGTCSQHSTWAIAQPALMRCAGKSPRLLSSVLNACVPSPVLVWF